MKQCLLFVLAFVLLVACRPISRGPNPYQAPSPLARGIESPLYGRGALPTLPDGLIAPEEQRSGAIPAILTAPRFKLNFPIMAHQQRRYPCGVVPMGAELMRLMIEDAEQMRKNPRCDNAMVAIAQNRANDMVRRKYFNHVDPDGWQPNHWLDVAGCLPDGYPENGNSVESITLNYHTAQAAWNALVSSKGHRPHVLGTHPFFAAQVAVGVGWSSNDWGEVAVILTSEGCK
jgi:hypothetical protein